MALKMRLRLLVHTSSEIDALFVAVLSYECKLGKRQPHTDVVLCSTTANSVVAESRPNFMQIAVEFDFVRLPAST